jgi:phospholipase A-2-activating protein
MSILADSYSSGKSDFIVKKHIPFTSFTTFDSCDASKILQKLKEFNNKVQHESVRVTENELENVIKLSSSPVKSDDVIVSLKKIMEWPKDMLFPVLDVIRLSVKFHETCEKLGGIDLIDFLIRHLSTTPANQLMSARALSNILTHALGRTLIESRFNDICTSLSSVHQGNANLQTAIATFLLNESIILKDTTSEEISTILTLEILKFLEWVSEPEATFRAYQALGNIAVFCSKETTSIIKAAEHFKSTLDTNKTALYEKLAEISSELSEKLL